MPACLTGKSSCSDIVIWSSVETKFRDLCAYKQTKKIWFKFLQINILSSLFHCMASTKALLVGLSFISYHLTIISSKEMDNLTPQTFWTFAFAGTLLHFPFSPTCILTLHWWQQLKNTILSNFPKSVITSPQRCSIMWLDTN